jgi:hypothetical protein
VDSAALASFDLQSFFKHWRRSHYFDPVDFFYSDILLVEEKWFRLLFQQELQMSILRKWKSSLLYAPK